MFTLFDEIPMDSRTWTTTGKVKKHRISFDSALTMHKFFPANKVAESVTKKALLESAKKKKPMPQPEAFERRRSSRMSKDAETIGMKDVGEEVVHEIAVAEDDDHPALTGEISVAVEAGCDKVDVPVVAISTTPKAARKSDIRSEDVNQVAVVASGSSVTPTAVRRSTRSLGAPAEMLVLPDSNRKTASAAKKRASSIAPAVPIAVDAVVIPEDDVAALAQEIAGVEVDEGKIEEEKVAEEVPVPPAAAEVEREKVAVSEEGMDRAQPPEHKKVFILQVPGPLLTILFSPAAGGARDGHGNSGGRRLQLRENQHRGEGERHQC